MLTPSETPSEEVEVSDPYGDVALGVECAWPESIPLIEPAEFLQ
jgi:hypothetical protein